MKLLGCMIKLLKLVRNGFQIIQMDTLIKERLNKIEVNSLMTETANKSKDAALGDILKGDHKK